MGDRGGEHLRRIVLKTAALFVVFLAGCESCSRAPAPDESPADAAPAHSASAGPVNVTPLPSSVVAAAINRDNLPAYSGPTGSIEGKVRVTGPAAPETPADFSRCPSATSIYGHAFREGKASTGPRELADAVVIVSGYSDFYIPEREEAEPLTIEGCGFARRTVTATFGQRIEVKNLTKEFWTPKLEPNPTTVMMMPTPGGEPVKLYPKKPGHYFIVDHDRKWAAIDLYVFLHPLHTTTKLDGSYRIDGVPVGKLKVSSSHPRIPDSGTTQDVEVKSGAVLHVDLVLENKLPVDAGAADAAPPPYPGLH